MPCRSRRRDEVRVAEHCWLSFLSLVAVTLQRSNREEEEGDAERSQLQQQCEQE